MVLTILYMLPEAYQSNLWLFKKYLINLVIRSPALSVRFFTLSVSREKRKTEQSKKMITTLVLNIVYSIVYLAQGYSMNTSLPSFKFIDASSGKDKKTCLLPSPTYNCPVDVPCLICLPLTLISTRSVTPQGK